MYVYVYGYYRCTVAEFISCGDVIIFMTSRDRLMAIYLPHYINFYQCPHHLIRSVCVCRSWFRVHMSGACRVHTVQASYGCLFPFYSLFKGAVRHLYYPVCTSRDGWVGYDSLMWMHPSSTIHVEIRIHSKRQEQRWSERVNALPNVHWKICVRQVITWFN